MSILERNCEWHFEKQPQAGQDIGPNNAAEAYFADTPYPSLIRESIQNSLDVVKDKSQPRKALVPIVKTPLGILTNSTFLSLTPRTSYFHTSLVLYPYDYLLLVSANICFYL